MNLTLAITIVELLEDKGEEAAVHADYSGRGMYGDTTAGVVCDGLGSILQVVIENAQDFVVDGDFPRFEIVAPLRIDSMGLSTIVY